MESLKEELRDVNHKISILNQTHTDMRTPGELTDYVRELIDTFDTIDSLLNVRTLDIPYELIPEDALIDIFFAYNSFDTEINIVAPSNTTIYPLNFPYSGLRGPRKEIERLFKTYLGKTASALIPYILGIEPINIRPVDFKSTTILKPSIGLNGAGTLIGIIDTGIDYTHPVFIDHKGETRIKAIWDQTIGTDSPLGYGTVYDQTRINTALKSADPFEIVPHKDEIGHGTILAGIAAGSGNYKDGKYEGVASGAELIIVKLKPASEAMQKLAHGRYNPLGFSSLDIALAIQFLISYANRLQKPISICLPSGTNSGSHDGANVLDSIINNYSVNPGTSIVISVGDEANKAHHASGDLKEEPEQEIKLKIARGEPGFFTDIWAMFGDRLEATLVPPNNLPAILLNEDQTYQLSSKSSVWSRGARLDIDTGCQVIRFRLENPMEGEWIIRIKGTDIIEGRYNMWIPKTGMISPGTVLSPGNPFTTIYNTGAAAGPISIGCYDRKSQSTCGSSGRGFTRDNRVSPDYITDGVDILGPLPDNKWGLITGSSSSSAIVTGVTSLIYENQLIEGEELANTTIMKAILAENVKRDPNTAYPNPSSGYGVIDIKLDYVRRGE